jgi:F420-non-reducing hydrogenase large subunit
MIGGKQIHPVCGLPGGVSTAITAEQRDRMVQITEGMVEFAKFSLQLFDDVVLKNNDYVDLIKSDAFTHATYNMGVVDADNKVNFYDGQIRVTGQDGSELEKFDGSDYLAHIAEHVEPYSYLVYPYLKSIGWKGFVDGKDSGVYKASPLSRLNAADGMATPLAQQEYERFFNTLGGKPVNATLATHWARLVELLYAAERAHELATDPDIIDPDVRNIPTGIVGEGVGVVEAPRGTLYHHYRTDDKGIVTNVNLIVGTTNNNAAISMSLKKAAEGLIKGGTEIGEGTLNMIEMAFRAYDPCFGCATHTLPGDMPLEVTVKSEATRETITSVKRNM